MKRLILHWTAGGNYPNSVDFLHYHFLIDKDGKIYNGKFPVSANKICRSDKSGKALYAAHTGGGNTESIGVAVCGMQDFDGNIKNTKFPLTSVQIEKMFAFSAKLCKKYTINISSETVLTHYEFGMANPSSSSHGKIDIIYLPSYPDIQSDKVGDFIRCKIKWYFEKDF